MATSVVAGDPEGFELPFGNCSLQRGPTLSVVSVIDGETLLLENGTEVRLIGAMTPRTPPIARRPKWHSAGSAGTNSLFSVIGAAAAGAGEVIAGTEGTILGNRRKERAGNRWPLAEDAVAQLSDLAAGRSVTLWTIAGSGARRGSSSSGALPLKSMPRDRYGRVLAQVTVHGDQPAKGQVWLQAALLKAGLARSYSAIDARACVRELQLHEVVARKAARKIWRHASYRVRRASRPATLAPYTHTFQVVEGRVQRVARYRKTTYLNFGRHWRTDFTLVVEGRAHRFLQKQGFDLTALQGRRVRVRGWIEERDGPMMRLTHAEQIEILDPGEPASDLLASGALEAFDRLREGGVQDTARRTPRGWGTDGFGRRARTPARRRPVSSTPAVREGSRSGTPQPERPGEAVKAITARPVPEVEYFSM